MPVFTYSVNKSTAWIGTKFDKDIHSSQRMYTTDIGDSGLTFLVLSEILYVDTY